MDSAQIYQAVSAGYTAAATSHVDANYASKVASSVGYSEEELKDVPGEANLGLSCGNPHVIANLKEVGG
jgi:arsenite methyltransferase